MEGWYKWHTHDHQCFASINGSQTWVLSLKKRKKVWQMLSHFTLQTHKHSFDLENGPGSYRNWYENGKLNGDYYYHAKSERSWLHSLWEKTNIKAFVCEQSSNDCWGIAEDCLVTKKTSKNTTILKQRFRSANHLSRLRMPQIIFHAGKKLENRSKYSNRVNDWWLWTHLQTKLRCMSDEDITSQSNEAKYIYLWLKVRSTGHQ